MRTALRTTIAALLVAAAPALRGAEARAQQPTVVVETRGPGSASRLLDSVLARPYTVIAGDTGGVALPLGREYRTTLIILGRDAAVSSRVRGDVIVIGGDLFVRPGAVIDGRAVAIGGGVYVSSIAVVRGGPLSYRDETYDARRTAGGWTLTHRVVLQQRAAEEASLFSNLDLLRIPTYDRVNGLSVGAAPTLTYGRFEVEPGLTWRTNLGKIDPSLTVRIPVDSALTLQVAAARTTTTNDAWIYSDITNSLFSFGLGRDVRNYYRADSVEATGRWRVAYGDARVLPYAGLRWERAWSTGHDSLSFAAGDPSTPFSFLGRNDDERMRRPNPRVTHGSIASIVGGVSADRRVEGVRTTGALDLELALDAPGSSRFLQTTLDGTVEFPTFGAQTFRVEAHAVLTAGDDAPPQRWAYLGGSGTVPTMELFEEGGDQLLFVESRYTIPVRRIDLPYLGNPELMLRHIIGGADVGSLPSLTQNVGVRVSVRYFRADFLVDPADGRTRLTFGVALAR